MKLRNKKTGEIWNVVQPDKYVNLYLVKDEIGYTFSYSSLAKLNANWEDVEIEERNSYETTQ